MEASQQGDPFATPPAEGDPFAAPAPAADEIASEPVTQEPPAAEAPPVVNREGEPVEQPTEAPQATEQPMSPEQAQGAPQEAQGAPESGVPTDAPQEAQEGPQQPQQPDAETEAANEAKVAAQPTPPAEAAQSSNGESGGKSQVRHYKLLYQTGDGQWTEFKLDPDSENVTVLDGQAWLLARNNDHATRLAWVVLGRPDDVTVFPVPRGAWKPRRIQPKPPEPTRERLVIS